LKLYTIQATIVLHTIVACGVSP